MDLAILKVNVDELNIDNLKTVPVHLSKLNNLSYNDFF